jgi:hypothetical protein
MLCLWLNWRVGHETHDSQVEDREKWKSKMLMSRLLFLLFEKSLLSLCTCLVQKCGHRVLLEYSNHKIVNLTLTLESYDCVLRNLSTEETVTHLFLECPFAMECWNIINIQIPNQAAFPQVSTQLRYQLNSDRVLHDCHSYYVLDYLGSSK